MDYTEKLLHEGLNVLKSRLSSGNRFIYDSVESIGYHKWVLNCISFLKESAPDHVEQIKTIYKPELALHHQAEKIFGIIQSAHEYIATKSKEKESLNPDMVASKSPEEFSLDFLSTKLRDKCADHFYLAKYDDAILNAAKVIEVAVRENSGLADTDLGVNSMRKAFRPDNPILKYSETKSEQEALMHLFSGFIGVFKNPHSHRFLEIKDPLSAFEIIIFANHLLGLLEKSIDNSAPNKAN